MSCSCSEGASQIRTQQAQHSHLLWCEALAATQARAQQRKRARLVHESAPKSLNTRQGSGNESRSLELQHAAMQQSELRCSAQHTEAMQLGCFPIPS